MTTLIEDIILNDDDELFQTVQLSESLVNFDKFKLSDVIYNFSILIDIRITALELYYNFEGDNSIELVNKITGIYQFSGSKILENYLFKICEKSKISSFLKLECAKSLHNFNEGKEDNDPVHVSGYISINNVCKDNINFMYLATPCKIDAICLLMKSDIFKNECRNYFIDIINNVLIDCNFRYKTILSLEKKDIKNKDFYLKESCIEFLDRNTNLITYRILSAQYLLQNCNLNNEIKKLVENILLMFRNDETLTYNKRSEESETLIRYGSDENKIRARHIITVLGREGQTIIKTVFSNAQNVHVEEIEKSVLDILDKLNNIPLKNNNERDLTFEFIEKQINDIIEERKKTQSSPDQLNNFEKIKISLNRINLDRALYSKYNCSLVNILVKVYSYIITSDSKYILIERLLEELIEMSGTCSTGFASRIINTISGFENFSIRISFEDQISSNIFGRLNSKIRDIEDEDIKNNILEEMTTNSITEKSNFYTFFISVIPTIKEEMYQEFKDYMEDTEFDFYMIKAISLYQYGDKFL